MRKEKKVLYHLPILGNGGLTLWTERLASTAVIPAARRNLVLPINKGLVRIGYGSYHLHHSRALNTFKVHFHHHRANPTHSNDRALNRHQTTHKIGLYVFEGSEWVKIQYSNSEVGIDNSINRRHNHYCCRHACDGIFWVFE